MTSMGGVLETMVDRLGCREECRFEERPDGHGGTCTATVMGLKIDSQSFSIELVPDDRLRLMAAHARPPFRLIEGKYVDACLLFSYINSRHPRGGRLYALDDGTVGFTHVLNAEDGGELTTQLVMNMVGDAISMFETHLEAIAAVALTGKTYEVIRGEYEERDRKRKDDPREWTPEPVYRKLKDG